MMSKHKAKLRFALILLIILFISLAMFYAVSAPRHMGYANAEGGV